MCLKTAHNLKVFFCAPVFSALVDETSYARPDQLGLVGALVEFSEVYTGERVVMEGGQSKTMQ